MAKAELGPYLIEGGMRFLADASYVQSAFQRDIIVYVNGFCRACQIDRAMDLEIPAKSLRFWHQRIDNVQIVVRDIGPMHEINVAVEMTFESDDQENLVPLDDTIASEMARAAMYSFLLSYETFYG